METLKEFREAAIDLSRNPLGIIALFIVLIYGFACLVTGLTGDFKETERLPLVWFLTLFPFAVLSVFGWLVAKYHYKLYGPKDIGPENFLAIAFPESSKIRFEAAQGELKVEGDVEIDEKLKSEGHTEAAEDRNFLKPKEDEEETHEAQEEEGPVEMGENDINVEASDLDLTTPEGRNIERQRLYEKKRYLFLSSVLVPSKRKGQKYDIFIYLVRHKRQDFSDVIKAEFFFGKSWGNKIFQGSREGNLIGVRISAYGPFLCTCRVTFTNQKTITLYHYIDFKMGDIVEQIFRSQ